MGKEFEIKIVNPDINEFKKMLQRLDAKKVHPKYRMKRHVFHHPDKNVDGFIRLRRESETKNTLTCKIFNTPSKYPLEYEVELKDSYEKALEFLQKSGLHLKSYQETEREKWSHPLAKEIVFDTWPGIPEFIEIDCENEENLKKLMQQLDVKKHNIRYDGVDSIYEELYKVPRREFNTIPHLTFNNYRDVLVGGGKMRRNTQKRRKTKKKSKRSNKTRKNKH